MIKNITKWYVKKYFIALKVEVDKLDINKLTNVPISLNNLETKVDDLDVGKSKSVPAYLRKLSDAVDNVKMLRIQSC